MARIRGDRVQKMYIQCPKAGFAAPGAVRREGSLGARLETDKAPHPSLPDTSWNPPRPPSNDLSKFCQKVLDILTKWEPYDPTLGRGISPVGPFKHDSS